MSRCVPARLTVVDGLGRADSDAIDYASFALGNCCGDGWVGGYPDVTRFLRFDFRKRSGLSYEGIMVYRVEPFAAQSAPAFATLSGERDVRIVVPAFGLEFRGHLTIPPNVSVNAYTLTSRSRAAATMGEPGSLATTTVPASDQS